MPATQIKALDRTTSTSVPDYLDIPYHKNTSPSDSRSSELQSPPNQLPLKYFAKQKQQPHNSR